MARAQKQNTLYVMHARLCRGEPNVVSDLDGELSHKRINHMSERGMHMLVEKDFLPEFKCVHLNQCVDCLADKQNRVALLSRPLIERNMLWN